VFALASATALALPLAPSASAVSLGPTTPRAAILYQAKLFRQGKFRVKYMTTYTANFRARCPYARYLADQRYGRRIMGPRFTLRDVRIRLQGPTRALLAYRYVSGDGRWVVAVTFKDGDVYVRQGRFWYDEHDGVTHC
jgi:hypothetical protein